MWFYFFKTAHLIFAIAWFAGLFYLPRLFVYHIEAMEGSGPNNIAISNQMAIMELRLINLIMRPAQWLTLSFGALMVFYNQDLLHQSWLQIKLALVVLLILYQYRCEKICHQLASSILPFSSSKMRIFNEIPTLLLIGIISFAVFKNQTNPFILIFSLVGIVLMILILTKIYKQIRHSEKP